MMSVLALLPGLLTIAVGIFQLCARDASWRLTERSNRARGVPSERTPEWETSNTVTGILIVICGLLLLGAASFAGAHNPPASPATTITVTDPATGQSLTRTLTEEEFRRYQRDPSEFLTITSVEMRQRRNSR